MDAPCKSFALVMSYDNQMFHLLDVTPPEEMEVEGPYCNSNAETDNSDENGEETFLPPPMPYFDRRTNATASAPMLMQDTLSRARSSYSPESDTTPRGREILQARTMTKSMPNMHTSRSAHNRGIGYSVLSKTAECGGNRGNQVLRSRIEEFDALLENL